MVKQQTETCKLFWVLLKFTFFNVKQFSLFVFYLFRKRVAALCLQLKLQPKIL